MGFMEQYVKFNQNPYSEGAYIGRWSTFKESTTGNTKWSWAQSLTKCAMFAIIIHYIARWNCRKSELVHCTWRLHVQPGYGNWNIAKSCLIAAMMPQNSIHWFACWVARPVSQAHLWTTSTFSNEVRAGRHKKLSGVPCCCTPLARWMEQWALRTVSRGPYSVVASWTKMNNNYFTKPYYLRSNFGWRDIRTETNTSRWEVTWTILLGLCKNETGNIR